ncbi:TonB-dependent receptor plug domain-containing protein [candidate division KSB1 bacterium]|nr:TonB-dependent receptor plug domain-containing protein [candidate division KSB1 bacterium]
MSNWRFEFSVLVAGFLMLQSGTSHALSLLQQAQPDTTVKKHTVPADTSQKVSAPDSTQFHTLLDSMQLASPGADSLQQVKAKKPAKPTIKFRSDSVAAIDTSCQLEHEQFSVFIHQDTGDLLRQFAGSNAIDPVSTGQPEYVGFHGLRSEQTTILLNGCPITHDQFGPLDLSIIPVKAIDRIEIIRDPADSPYPNAGGAINICTREYEGAKQPVSYVFYNKGANNCSDVDVMFGQKISTNARLNAGILYTNYDGDYPHSRHESQKIRNQVSSYLGTNWHATYFLLYNKFDTDIPGIIYPETGSPATPGAHEKIVRYDHTVNLRGNAFADSTEDVAINLFYVSQYHEFRDHPNSIDEINRNRFGGILAESYFEIANQNITVGNEIQARAIKGVGSDQHVHYNNRLFFRDVIAVSSRLRVKLLGSFETHSVFGSYFSPSGTVELMEYWDSKLAVNVSHARRLPNFFELYRNNRYQQGNSILKPEELNSIEARLSLKRFEYLRANTNVYWRTVRRPVRMMAIPDTDRVTFANFDKNSFYGADIDLYWQSHPRWYCGLRAEVLVAYDETETHLPDLPLYSGQAYFGFFQNLFKDDMKLHSRFYFRLPGTRWSPYYRLPAKPYSFTTELVELPADPVLDFRIVAVIRSVEFFFSMENILGRKYQVRYGYPGRGRSIHWGLTWKFLD